MPLNLGPDRVQPAWAAYRPWIMRLAKVLVLGVVIWGVHKTWLNALDRLSQPETRAQLRWSPGWLGASMVVYLLGILPCGLFWRRVLAALGLVVSRWNALRAYYIGHLGKYVPGKGMVVVLRAGLIPRPAGTTAPAALAVFYETMTMMSVGALLSTALLATLPFPAHGHRSLWLLLGSGMAALTGVMTMPPGFRLVAVRLIRGGQEPVVQARLAAINWTNLGRGALLMTSGWIVTGLSLWMAGRGIGAPLAATPHVWLACVATAGLGMVGGFLSFLPGGLVVRESILMELLVLLVGLSEPTAAATAIVWRLSGMVAEVVLATILYGAGERLRKPVSDQPADPSSPPSALAP